MTERPAGYPLAIMTDSTFSTDVADADFAMRRHGGRADRGPVEARTLAVAARAFRARSRQAQRRAAGRQRGADQRRRVRLPRAAGDDGAGGPLRRRRRHAGRRCLRPWEVAARGPGGPTEHPGPRHPLDARTGRSHDDLPSCPTALTCNCSSTIAPVSRRRPAPHRRDATVAGFSCCLCAEVRAMTRSQLAVARKCVCFHG